MTPTPATTPLPTATPTGSWLGAVLGSTDPLVIFLFDLVKGLGLFAIALVLANLVRRWVVRFVSRTRISLNVAVLLSNIAQVLIIFLGIIPIAGVVGIDWTALVTVLGAVGLALSLSMQDLLKNVIAGVYILLEQPFKIGDHITVKDATGVVRSIELRTTIIRTDEGLQMVVPNNTVLNEIVTNRSVSDIQRQVLSVSMPERSLTDSTNRITAALHGFNTIAVSPAPTVTMDSVNGGILRLHVEYWVPVGTGQTVTPQVAEALHVLFPEADVTVVG